MRSQLPNEWPLRGKQLRPPPFRGTPLQRLPSCKNRMSTNRLAKASKKRRYDIRIHDPVEFHEFCRQKAERELLFSGERYNSGQGERRRECRATRGIAEIIATSPLASINSFFFFFPLSFQSSSSFNNHLVTLTNVITVTVCSWNLFFTLVTQNKRCLVI